MSEILHRLYYVEEYHLAVHRPCVSGVVDVHSSTTKYNYLLLFSVVCIECIYFMLFSMCIKKRFVILIIPDEFVNHAEFGFNIKFKYTHYFKRYSFGVATYIRTPICKMLPNK